MVKTEETGKLLDGLLDIAKGIRAQYKYSEDEKFASLCIILSEAGGEFVLTPWNTNDDKYRMMKMVSDRAREKKAEIVGVVTDTRWTDSGKLCAHFKVPEPKGQESFAVFKSWYFGILQQHGGQIKNLPREVWSEAVMVAAKGPNIPTTAMFAPYIEGPNDTVLYTAKNSDSPNGDAGGNLYELGLIPDWWTQ